MVLTDAALRDRPSAIEAPDVAALLAHSSRDVVYVGYVFTVPGVTASALRTWSHEYLG